MLIHKIQRKFFNMYKILNFSLIPRENSNFSICTNFDFSQKFPVKSQIFLHIKIVPIMYEYRKVTDALGNKIAITSYP